MDTKGSLIDSSVGKAYMCNFTVPRDQLVMLEEKKRRKKREEKGERGSWSDELGW